MSFFRMVAVLPIGPLSLATRRRAQPALLAQPAQRLPRQLELERLGGARGQRHLPLAQLQLACGRAGIACGQAERALQRVAVRVGDLDRAHPALGDLHRAARDRRLRALARAQVGEGVGRLRVGRVRDDDRVGDHGRQDGGGEEELVVTLILERSSAERRFEEPGGRRVGGGVAHADLRRIAELDADEVAGLDRYRGVEGVRDDYVRSVARRLPRLVGGTAVAVEHAQPEGAGGVTHAERRDPASGRHDVHVEVPQLLLLEDDAPQAVVQAFPRDAGRVRMIAPDLHRGGRRGHGQ